MTGEVIALADRRPPVTFSVTLTVHWDNSLTVFVHDVSDDPRSRASVADALRRAADSIESVDVI